MTLVENDKEQGEAYGAMARGKGEGGRKGGAVLTGVLTLDWLEEVPSCLEACIGTVVTFWGETHCGAITAAGVGLGIVAL